jgi:hypothetical protein
VERDNLLWAKRGSRRQPPQTSDHPPDPRLKMGGEDDARSCGEASTGRRGEGNGKRSVSGLSGAAAAPDAQNHRWSCRAARPSAVGWPAEAHALSKGSQWRKVVGGYYRRRLRGGWTLG